MTACQTYFNRASSRRMISGRSRTPVTATSNPSSVSASAAKSPRSDQSCKCDFVVEGIGEHKVQGARLDVTSGEEFLKPAIMKFIISVPVRWRVALAGLLVLLL